MDDIPSQSGLFVRVASDRMASAAFENERNRGPKI
jgi:hypothetical protein